MSDQQQQIMQRLWYTAPSRIGRDGTPIQGGESFRVCAVTDGLNRDIYEGGAQVRALERYARYTPPDDTVRDDVTVYDEIPDLDLKNQSDAPICLSLIDILNPEVLDNQELAAKLHGRVLVNKIYLGRVGDGREGNVFIDLLANLPDGFSAHEALALWRAPDFWQQRYESTYSDSRRLLAPVELPHALLREIAMRQSRAMLKSVAVPALPGSIPPGASIRQEPLLRNPFALTSLQPETEKQLTEILAFLIHAYLLQQHEEWTETNKIYKKRLEIEKDLDMLRKAKPSSGLLNLNLGSQSKIKAKEQDYAQILDIQRQRQRHFQRIYLAAEDDRVAYCLMLLTGLLQDIPSLLQPLTFSTYEYKDKVLECECLIVCTSASRAAEKDHKKLAQLLPGDCNKLGFVYNAYYTASNPPLPHYLPAYDPQFQMDAYRVESVARDLARKLLKPNGRRFAQHFSEVVEQISANEPSSPAQQLVFHWQKKLVAAYLLQKQYLSRAEAARLFEDPQWWECLEEPEITRQVFQWVVADCKGLDLDELSQSWVLRKGQETGAWLKHTLLPAIMNFVGRRVSDPKVGPIADSVATNLGALLEEYADNLAQPDIYGGTEIPAYQSSEAGTRLRFDVIATYKHERDPEAFEALLRTLQRCEPAVKGSSTWTRLFNYLFSTRLTADGKRVFLHAEAGSFVLRHLHDTSLAAKIAKNDEAAAKILECHWSIHFRLFCLANETLPEESSGLLSEPLALITPLLQIPMNRYMYLFGDDATRKSWYISWRKEALIYQINKIQADGTANRFTGQHWETYQTTQKETQFYCDLIGKPAYWPTHFLLVIEAMDCFTEWEDALPLLDPQVPPFQAELMQKLDAPERVIEIQRVIWQQTLTKHPENIRAVISFYEKLIQGGYSEAHTMLLLKPWLDRWMQEQVSNKDLSYIIRVSTNLGPNSLRKLLGS